VHGLRHAPKKRKVSYQVTIDGRLSSMRDALSLVLKKRPAADPKIRQRF
jgi:hypothetical protein